MKYVKNFLGTKVVGPFQRRLLWTTRRFYRDDNPDPARSIFVSGAGRSGTTWLVETLNANNDHRLLYEPFNCDQVGRCRHFSERQYLRPNDTNPIYLGPAREIFSGTVRDPWIDQYNLCKNARFRLVKDVRSTLMLKWIRNHFPTMPIVFIMRHPCAVALSRLDLGWRTDLKESVFLPQETLMRDYLAPLFERVAWADTAFERYVIDWCVENLVPLAQLDSGDVYLVFYEHLVANPAQEFRKLFSFLDRPFNDGVLGQIGRRSASSRRRRGNLGAERSRDNHIHGWRKYVSEKQRAAAERITRIFGLDRIYSEDASPNLQEVQSIFSHAGTRL